MGGDAMTAALRRALYDSLTIEDHPDYVVGKTVHELWSAIKYLERLQSEPLTRRHVRADRADLQRMAVRLMHLAQH